MKKLLVLLLIVSCQLFIANCSAQSVSATLIANVTCHGQSNGSVTCTPSGGTMPYTYLWAPGSQTTQTATGLTAATYTITLHDHLAHTASASVTVSQPAALSVTASAKFSSVCPGNSDSLFANASGGTAPFSYLWTAPYGDISCPTCSKTNSYPYGVAYMVTAVYDGNGCTATSNVNITVYPFPYVTISGPVSPVRPSHSDSLVAHAIGATSYLWSNSSTKSNMIVSPAVPTTYSVKVTNGQGCVDSAKYTIDTNSVGNGSSSSNAIRIVPSATLNMASFTTTDSAVWFKFVPTDSNNQIIANSAYLGMPVAHVHRLTLYNNSLQMLVDEPMPDIAGANQIRIDISHLHIGSTYYVRASRCPAHANMAGCNPSASGECNPTQRWDFQMGFRTVTVFVPKDSGAEAPAVSQLYYEHRGQIADLNNIPRFDIKAYTNNTKPAVFCSDSAVSFVYQHVDTAKSFRDTVQRVDMVLTGTNALPSQPVFKMEEDSNAGYLNYFLGYVPNGVPKVEGYSRLVYKNVYPNVDMQVYSNTVGTKLYFVCNPGGTGGGGNPANIELQFKGASSVSVNGSGGLNVVTELGTLTFAPGFAYTDSAGTVKHKSWQAYFIVVNSNTVRFNTGSYNTNEPLVIEVDRGHKIATNYPPIDNLDWSTYFGATDNFGQIFDICSDATGNVYATGATASFNYPVTAGVVQDTSGNLNIINLENAILAKFSNAPYDSLIWSTYYGGSLATTVAYGVTDDARGYIYMTGVTWSYTLPRASNPSSIHNYVQYDINSTPSDHINSDAFIAMFSNDGTKTLWTTYYGGTKASEVGKHIAVDGNYNVYAVGGGVDGEVNTTFPLYASTKPGAYNDSVYGTGFIIEFNASNLSAGISREWATRIGDSNTDTRNGFESEAILNGCTVDVSNNFYVTGVASAGEYTYPATLTFPYKGVANSGINAVITKFNSNNSIAWSSYYGGNGGGGSAGEVGYAVAVDQSGNAYITGNSESDSSYGIGIETQPLGGGYFQRYNKGSDGFIAEFNPTGSLTWGTYFGGPGILYGFALKVDAYNNLYLTGSDRLDSLPFPGSWPVGVYVQTSPINRRTGYDAFIATFRNSNTAPGYLWGTYFGNNQAQGMCITKSNGYNWLYIAGQQGNGNTPLVFPAGSWQQSSFYYDSVFTNGTPFISQFNIDLIIGPAGVSTVNTLTSNVSVYPNPTAQNISVKVDLTQTQDVEFTLYNAMGEEVYDKRLLQQSGTIIQQIDLSAFPNGIYLIKVNRNGTYSTQKIIKQS